MFLGSTASGKRRYLMQFVAVFLLFLYTLSVPFGVHASEKKISSLEDHLYQLQALVTYTEQSYTQKNHTLTETELRSLITEGVHYLVQAQEGNGHFAYEYEPYADTYRNDDNIVRQAGALYALGEVVRLSNTADPVLNEAIESAIEYFDNLSEADTVSSISFRCIVDGTKSSRCKLGATSLALSGILSYVSRYPEKQAVYAALIDDYIAYILVSKKEDGGFRSVHNIGTKSRIASESPFANGEVLLALVRSYQYNRDETIKQYALATYEYLALQEFDTALYLWIMAALKDMQMLWSNESYSTYAKEFTSWRVDGVAYRKGTDKNYCAYAEGVASAYSVIKDSLSLKEKEMLESELAFWNTHNSHLQIGQNARYRFAYTPENDLQLHAIKNPEQAQGGFLTSEENPTLRIDFTQHCVSAYLQTLVDINKKEL